MNFQLLYPGGLGMGACTSCLSNSTVNQLDFIHIDTFHIKAEEYSLFRPMEHLKIPGHKQTLTMLKAKSYKVCFMITVELN